MYLFCLSQSAKVLHLERSNNAAENSTEWRKLAENYYKIALAMLSKYMNVDSLPTGGVIQNRYPADRTRTVVSPTIQPGTRSY
jgi:hypothetical protein